MAADGVTGEGTKRDPWILKTPPGRSEYKVYRDEGAEPPPLVCIVEKIQLGYRLRCLEDLHAMLKDYGDRMMLGSTDEQKEPKEATIEAWGRSPDNPVGGWYGLRKGFRGRFANYVPPVMEYQGLAEVEHKGRNNRMRAL